jgi:DNA-binding response OmpR family regulator
MAVVLVVEDEPLLRSSMVRGLSKNPDLTLIEAGTIKQAIAMVASTRPSLIISDLDLPDGSGIEILTAMDNASLVAPLIYVSAHLDKYKASIPRRAEVHLCEKPVGLETLRSLVRQLLANPSNNATAAPFGLDEYIQLACMGQHSIQIRVEKHKDPIGSIVIRSGEIWSAEDSSGSGEEALRRMIAAKGLKIVCETLHTDPATRNISPQPWFGILLEAARLKDETSKDTPDLNLPFPVAAPEPPPQEVSEVAFNRLMERGIEATLTRNYQEALQAFHDAKKLRPSDRLVEANIRRLHALGYRD